MQGEVPEPHIPGDSVGVAVPGIRHHSAIRLRESNWPASSDFPVPSPKWMTSGANGPGCPPAAVAIILAAGPPCTPQASLGASSWSPGNGFHGAHSPCPQACVLPGRARSPGGRQLPHPRMTPQPRGLNGAVIKGAAVGLGGTWRGLALGLWRCGADLWRTELELGGHEVCMSTAPARSPGFLGRSCWGIRAPWAPQAQPLRTTAATPHHCLHFHILQRGTSPLLWHLRSEDLPPPRGPEALMPQVLGLERC